MRDASRWRSRRLRFPLPRRFSRPTGVCGAFCLALLLSQSSPGPCFSGVGLPPRQPTEVEQDVSEGELTAWELDEFYERLLADSERLAAVWQQQPGNLKALERYVTELRSQVARVRGFREAAGTARPPVSTEASATEAEAKSPAGPVGPSREPSSEEEMEKRRKATLDRFLSSGPLERAKPGPSLAGVPGEWIAESCDRTDEELKAMARLFAAETPDSGAVESSLRRLRAILEGMGAPPLDAAPSGPSP